MGHGEVRFLVCLHRHEVAWSIIPAWCSKGLKGRRRPTSIHFRRYIRQRLRWILLVNRTRQVDIHQPPFPLRARCTRLRLRHTLVAISGYPWRRRSPPLPALFSIMPLPLRRLLHLLHPILLQLRALRQVTRPEMLPTPLQRIEIRDFPLMLIALVLLVKIIRRAVKEGSLLLLLPRQA